MQRLDIDKEGEKSGDEIYRRFSPVILSYLCQHVSTQQDAEDILFDVFIAALKNEDFIHFTDTRQIAWLQQVAKNKVIDHYRHLKLIPMLPLAKLELDISQCTGLTAKWNFAVGAPGYMIVNGKYPF